MIIRFLLAIVSIPIYFYVGTIIFVAVAGFFFGCSGDGTLRGLTLIEDKCIERWEIINFWIDRFILISVPVIGILVYKISKRFDK